LVYDDAAMHHMAMPQVSLTGFSEGTTNFAWSFGGGVWQMVGDTVTNRRQTFHNTYSAESPSGIGIKGPLLKTLVEPRINREFLCTMPRQTLLLPLKTPAL
jgi:hypothetical protein